MAFGCFVDIYQQDGKPVRMHYEGLTVDTVNIVKWIGIMEETAKSFRPLPTDAEIEEISDAKV